jgi:hypothetical protein
MQSTPALCIECRDERYALSLASGERHNYWYQIIKLIDRLIQSTTRLLDFAFTTLTVRVYEPGESTVDEKVPASPTSTDPSQASTSSKASPSSNTTNSVKSKRKQAPATPAAGMRQSKRLKESKNPYKEIRIQNISKEDTVMDLKMKVIPRFLGSSYGSGYSFYFISLTYTFIFPSLPIDYAKDGHCSSLSEAAIRTS